MRRLLLFISLIIILGLAGGLYRITRQGLPVLDGKITTNIKREVEIRRDALGIPHLKASSLEDLFFAQGYIQAMDRLFQMDLTRRVVDGRLSEIFGEDFLDTDYFLRSLLLGYTAREALPYLEPTSKALLERYAEGVNAYLRDNRNNLPPEFRLLGYQPEEWKVEHTLGVGKYMAWELGGNMSTELFLWTALKELPRELVEEIFPSYPDDAPTIIPQLDLSKDDIPQLLSLLKTISTIKTGVSGEELGSNNWVIGGEKTLSGHPLLANDMHLGMGIPSIWYQTRLQIPKELTLSGIIFPGVPGIIVGVNDNIAWGVTNVGPDVQDLYLERRHPQDPYSFEYNGSWEKAKVLEEVFHVKGQQDPIKREIIITHNGPLIFDGEEPLSLRWTAHDKTQEIEALIGLAKAKDFEGFLEAISLFHVPAQNFVMADREGNIGYRANGRIPIRGKGDGLIPVPGWDPEYQWQGYIPFDELPTLYNPEEGFISTANNKITPPDYPYFISHQWASPYRALSIQENLKESRDFTVMDMKELQFNRDNLQARLLLPLMKEDLYSCTFGEKETQALEILYRWGEDPRDDPNHPAPAIYHTFYLKAIEETFLGIMGKELYHEFLQIGIINIFDKMLLEGSLWFQEGGGVRAVLERAFKAAIRDLQKGLGERVEDWKWGDLHQIYLTHHLSQVPLLGTILNDGPYPMGGSHVTIAAASYSFVKPFGVISSAPWRLIVDLGDVEGNTWENLAAGVSGHPFSPHYRDQTKMWLEGEYTKVHFRGDPIGEGLKLLRLIPKEE